MSRRKSPQTDNIGTRAVGYVRVSTGKQALSPEAQREKILAMAALQGVALIETIEDRETAKEGSIHKRAGIIRILELVRAGRIDRVIIAKIDRLTRSVVDLGAILTLLDKQNCSLVSATETWLDTGSAGGRLVLNIIVSVAQWEREAIGERTSAVLQMKRAHHQPYNHDPYGWAREGEKLPQCPDCVKLLHAAYGCAAHSRLVEMPEEQAVILRVREMRAARGSLRSIAERLNDSRVKTKIQGGKWHASSVANVLKAPPA